MRILRT